MLTTNVITGTVAFADSSSPDVRVGSAPSVPHAAHAAAAPSGNQKLTLDVQLAPRNAALLKNLVKAVSTPGNAEYHHYLTSAQYAEYFAPSAATVAATESALKARGLTVDSVADSGGFITVSTTFDGAKKAFSTSFTGYRLGDRTVYANTSAPSVPAAIAADVVGITGLDDIAKPTQHLAKPVKPAPVAAKSASASAHAARPNFTPPQVCSNITGGFNSQNIFDGRDYYSPASLAAVYGTSGQLAAGDRGSGVTVGVFELEKPDTSALGIFNSCLGISTPVSYVKVDGGPTQAPDWKTGFGVESDLDIETIAGLAPGVSIVDYEGPETATPQQIIDVYTKMVSDDTVNVISTSWGYCEIDQNSSVITAETSLFDQAALQGQTVVAASGDSGSTDCDRIGGPDAAKLVVDDPAAQPNVLAVGGTSMTGGTVDPTVTTWNNSSGTAAAPSGGASGGGTSDLHSLASGGFQAGFTGAGYSNSCGATGADTCRQVPDVSASADPAHGYLMTVFYSGDTSNPAGEYWFIIGGTSAAAPLWASIAALADASKDCVGNGPVGLVDPALYQAAKQSGQNVVTDVTVGNNVLAYSAYPGPLYSAGTGYDLVTGLGTPLAGGLVQALCSSVPTPTGGSLVPVAPTRLLDTRDGTGGTHGAVGKLSTINLQVTGRTLADSTTIPTTGVSAVVLNVTATQESSFGFVSVYPGGTTRSAASNLNYNTKTDVANLVIVPVGKNGSVNLYNGSPFGSTQLVADVSGYFTTTPPATASTFTKFGPTRIMDSRSGTGVPGAIASGKSVSLQVTGGTTNIPTGATAVVMNITATHETSYGHITAYPDNGANTPVPNVSNVNFGVNNDVPNLAVIPVGQDGIVDFAFAGLPGGTTQIVGDVTGYFMPGTAGDKFHASRPSRVLDTRDGTGQAASGPIGGRSTMTFSLGDIPASALATSDAVVANLTIADPVSGGFLTAFPYTGPTVPNVSNLNFSAKQDISDFAVVPNVNGTLGFYNNAMNNTQFIMDVFGYFSAN